MLIAPGRCSSSYSSAGNTSTSCASWATSCCTRARSIPRTVISARDYTRVVSTALSEAPFRLPETADRSDLVAKYFHTLADSTRLRILQLLRDQGRLSVGEIAERLAVSQPGVSNHLACL